MKTLFISLATLLALAGCRQANNGAIDNDDNPRGTRSDDLERSRTRAPADVPDRIPTPNIGDPGNDRAGGGAGPSGQTGTTGSTMGDDGLVRPGGGNTTAPGTPGTIERDGGIGAGGGPTMDRNPTAPAGPSIDRGAPNNGTVSPDAGATGGETPGAGEVST